MTLAIRTEGLQKRYQLGEIHRGSYVTLRETIMSWLRGRRPKRNEESLWALNGIDLEVPVGEVLGVVGANGSGKTTLLKVLSRITPPTHGRAEIVGRVGSLLEVGTGFHPELTGRENVFLNGAILGMTRVEISRKFDEIIAFAGVEEFVDTPVKRFSSGMYVRLAFAVAAHMEPEILLVDEVLAVGDARFQRRCLGKMGEIASQGRTILFVSHNLSSVQNLCGRAIWLDHGEIRAEGPPGRVINDYLRSNSDEVSQKQWDDPEEAPGNDLFRLHRVSVAREGGSPLDPITTDDPIDVMFEYWLPTDGVMLSPSVHLFNGEGTMLFNSGPVEEPNWFGRLMPAGRYASSFRIPGRFLNDGLHRLTLLAVRDQTRVAHRFEHVVAFEVVDSGSQRDAYYGHWPGAVRPSFPWTTVQIQAT